MSVAIFIDTNQYLKLYGVVGGKELLEALEEQKKYIFVPMQLVDEVMRNKLSCAERFFSDKIKEIGAIDAVVPDHLLGIGDNKVAELRAIIQRAGETKKEIRDLGAKSLAQISRSEDDVSKRLGVIFEGAIKPSPEELERARQRREVGNPPGYFGDPLGDQIAWEQLLTYCRIAGVKRLWVASNDGDYVTKFDKRVLLNSFLHRELMQTCGDEVEVRCFDNVMGAVEDFGKKAGVRAEKLPSEEKSKQIEKELQALPQRNLFSEQFVLEMAEAAAEALIAGHPLPIARPLTRSLVEQWKRKNPFGKGTSTSPKRPPG
jgi:PIN like domain